ncbi:hypothetical protein [Seonamhaeicola marinus]|uniref:hypothetical protein n=1 Tax=Seonamhaeicola marinus TaxID=1912246 RepID=UPI0016528CF8|nr:hypothetical protein [Seonamhaeicola marinus]
MNLQKLNVQEMQTEELMETSGSGDGLWDLYWKIMKDPDSWKWTELIEFRFVGIL